MNKLSIKFNLNEQEDAALALVMKGYSIREMVNTLLRSDGTVKMYLGNIFKKTGVRDRINLALKMSRLGYDAAEESLLPAKRISHVEEVLPTGKTPC